MGESISSLVNTLDSSKCLIPREYVKVMRISMLNKRPTSSYSQICDVSTKELGKLPHEVFFGVQFHPIGKCFACSSACYSHLDGKKVAVKVSTHI
ncbi:hypothetical protein SUGI_0523500 [Cryptomeria japonica]|nr:hypothetical protein SUGI_0523500 [Cryptomeria japonica]